MPDNQEKLLTSWSAPSQPAPTQVLLIRAHLQKLNRAPGFPVGIGLIAAYLESQGISVRVLDLAMQKDWKRALQSELGRHPYGFVGVSFQITQHDEAFEVARCVREAQPAAQIVFGGSYPSSAPVECISNPDVDVVCCGEGEATMLELIRARENGRPFEEIAGIVCRGKDGRPVKTPARALIENLDTMPLPAYHLFDLEPYVGAEHTSDFTGKKHRCMELITSRGCPYHCIYCHSFFGKKFRGRSPQHVMDEILLLHDSCRISEFVIWDDTFTMDVQRAKDICDLIIRSGIKISIQLRGGVRVEQMDEELMAKLKKAGVETMCVGIESAVWRIQTMIKKNLRIRKVEELLDLAAKYNITTIGLMMLGFPGERVEEIRESIRWAYRSRLDYTFFSIVTPYPGTELYDLALREGYYKIEQDFRNMNVMVPHLETTEVKPGMVKWLQIQAYLMFYLRPRRLRKLLSSAYTLKAFAGGLLNYMSVAVSYYGRRFSSQSH